MAKSIVSDAGPLIAFGRINQLEIISQLFGVILIPESVADECLVNLSLPGASAIQHAMTAGIVKRNAAIAEGSELLDSLGKGEAMAIRLAAMKNIPLIIDEKLGRGVAKKLGVRIIGTAGILLLAKQQQIIATVKPLLMQLKQSKYHLSDELMQIVLKQANET